MGEPKSGKTTFINNLIKLISEKKKGEKEKIHWINVDALGINKIKGYYTQSGW